jgi:quercetin dioxygenase-like cupin family protein
MDEKIIIQKLIEQGYQDVRVHPLNTLGIESEPHTHEESTVHVILEGELTMTELGSVKTIKKGDMLLIPAGTTHTIKTPPEGCKFVVGVKKSY